MSWSLLAERRDGWSLVLDDAHVSALGSEADAFAHVEARSDESEAAGPLLPLAEGFAQRSKGRFLNISVKTRQLTQFSSDTARNSQISAMS